MTSAPLLRINGSVVQVIIDGWVVDSFPHSDGAFAVHVEDAAIEITSNGQTLQRYRLDPHVTANEPARERGVAQISVEETDEPTEATPEPTPTSDAMFY